jgi:site-specific DNA recombinase
MNNITFNRFGRGKLKEADKVSNCAVIYTRVSTKEQMDNNHSLGTQKKFCQEYADKHGLEVLSYFGGTYESAQTDERDEFNRLMKFCNRAEKRVSHILVYTLDRFSRSGENAIYISAELKKRGISIVSVTQPIDTTSHAGTLQQNIQFIFSKYDNDLRRQKAVDGMKEKIRRGEWMGKPPLGYSKLKKDGNEEIVINAKGELIKKAFYWKLKDGLSNMEIVQKLKMAGLNLGYKQNLTKIFKNPFYCGLIAHKMLEGEVIEGKQPALISKEVFLKVNDIQLNNNVSGYRHTAGNENLPLRQFVKCEDCQSAFTGYIAKKRIYYYKCNQIGCKCNRNAEFMHERFEYRLCNYKLKKGAYNLIKHSFGKIYDVLTHAAYENKKSAEMKIAALREKLEKLEERFAFGEIDRSIFDKYASPLKVELNRFQQQRDEEAQIRLSNGIEYWEYALDKCMNLAPEWASGELPEKTKLQKLVFPEGILFSKKINDYRTPTVNTIFELFDRTNKGFDPNKKGLLASELLKVPSCADRGTRTHTPRGTRS